MFGYLFLVLSDQPAALSLMGPCDVLGGVPGTQLSAVYVTEVERVKEPGSRTIIVVSFMIMATVSDPLF